MWSKRAKRSLLLTTCVFFFFFFFFFAFKVPHAKNSLLQQLLVGSAHVERCSKFVRQLLENENRTISDVIGQFYGWLFFGSTTVGRIYDRNLL